MNHHVSVPEQRSELVFGNVGFEKQRLREAHRRSSPRDGGDGLNAGLGGERRQATGSDIAGGAGDDDFHVFKGARFVQLLRAEGTGRSAGQATASGARLSSWFNEALRFG